MTPRRKKIIHTKNHRKLWILESFCRQTWIIYTFRLNYFSFWFVVCILSSLSLHIQNHISHNALLFLCFSSYYKQKRQSTVASFCFWEKTSSSNRFLCRTCFCKYCRFVHQKVRSMCLSHFWWSHRFLFPFVLLLLVERRAEPLLPVLYMDEKQNVSAEKKVLKKVGKIQ